MNPPGTGKKHRVVIKPSQCGRMPSKARLFAFKIRTSIHHLTSHHRRNLHPPRGKNGPPTQSPANLSPSPAPSTKSPPLTQAPPLTQGSPSPPTRSLTKPSEPPSRGLERGPVRRTKRERTVCRSAVSTTAKPDRQGWDITRRRVRCRGGPKKGRLHEACEAARMGRAGAPSSGGRGQVLSGEKPGMSRRAHVMSGR
ncbi:hypothetical protein BDY21DRAFT_341366 [Lineolata rhizophorae]|uniref:Uncharacterized protein n=1 Tax=Lineolata rhizophorae TaxID=578093 RepID=A0A6A6P4U0_9PEZI|nr:hypothetical protein BDY21DRAFT_341366 [Lineolata rhizophorae]